MPKRVPGQSSPELTAPIQAAVLDSLGDMIHQNVRLGLQIRNSAGNLQHPVKGPGRQAQFVDGRLQQAARGVIDLTVGFDVAAAHLCVAVLTCLRFLYHPLN